MMVRLETSLNYWVTLCVIGVTVSALLAEGHSREKRNNRVKVTTIEEPPYVKLKSATGSGNDNFEGFIPDLLKKLATKLNFQYELHIVKDKAYGTKRPDGTWNGMIGELTSHDADLVAAPITISSEREKAVEFTESFMNVGNIILMKKDYSTKIHSATDLAAQDKIKYGVVKNGVTESFFKNSEIPVYKKMWEKMSADKDNLLVSNASVGVQKVRNEDYAFIIESTTAHYWKYRQPCDLMTIGDMINSNGHAFAVRQGDPLSKRLGDEIKKMRENGQIQLLKQKYWKKDCPIFGGAATASMSVYHKFFLLVAVSFLSLWQFFAN